MIRLAPLLALLILGCATPAKVVPVTTKVSVPVATVAVAPAALLACGQAVPGFRFYEPLDGSQDAVVRAEDQAALQVWVNEKVRCIRAWQAWGSP